jgi:tRNA-dihydrouridine synthase
VLGTPWFFRSKEQARLRARGVKDLGVGRNAGEVSLDERLAVLIDHARLFQKLVGEKQFYRMRKHLGWYCKGFPHAASLRARMVQVSSAEELQAVLAEFQDRPEEATDLTLPESVDAPNMLTSRCG